MALDPFKTSALRPPAVWLPLELATQRCKGCELCVAACPKACLALDAGIVNALGYHPIRLIDPAACTSCAFCARVCPDAVFTVYAAPKAPHDKREAAATEAVQ